MSVSTFTLRQSHIYVYTYSINVSNKNISVPLVCFILFWILVQLLAHVMCICREEFIPNYLYWCVSVCKVLHHVSADTRNHQAVHILRELDISLCKVRANCIVLYRLQYLRRHWAIMHKICKMKYTELDNKCWPDVCATNFASTAFYWCGRKELGSRLLLSSVYFILYVCAWRSAAYEATELYAGKYLLPLRWTVLYYILN